MHRTTWGTLALAAVAACEGKAKAPQPAATAGQTFAQGIEAICATPADSHAADAAPMDRAARMSTWANAHVTNPDARAVFEALGGPSAGGRRAALEDGVRRAGLSSCAGIDELAPWPVPDVGSLTLDRPAAGATTLAVTPTAVVLGEQAVTTVEGGRLGEPAKVTAALAAAAPGPLLIAADPATPYAVVFDVLAAAKASRPELALVAVHAGERGTVRLWLPPTPAADAAPPLRMAVAVTAADVTVFSFSGEEGTLGSPAAHLAVDGTTAPAIDLRRRLGELVARRWPAGATRADADLELVVMVDDPVTMQVLTPLLAAVVRAPDSTPLFPRVVLGRAVTGESRRVEAPPTVATTPDVATLPPPSRAGGLTIAGAEAEGATSLSSGAVTAKIENVYVPGLTRCYKALLKQDPTATCKVSLELTVNETGRVGARTVTVDGDYPTLRGCVDDQVGRWTFPAPTDGGEATTASFHLALRFVPAP